MLYGRFIIFCNPVESAFKPVGRFIAQSGQTLNTNGLDEQFSSADGGFMVYALVGSAFFCQFIERISSGVIQSVISE